jgi:crossover junction endodeoxyribonuclease RuvC
VSRLLGVDPGASGALSLLDTETGLIDVEDMPVVTIKRGTRNVRQVQPALLVDIITRLAPDEAFVERVSAMPGQGVSSMFAFGRAMGVVEGVLAGLGVRYTDVPPATWIKAMGVRGGKDGARNRAIELYPRQANLFSRVKDDGRADATLIATWGASRE